ncbi:hypothetical protein C7T94_07650 [Pedobacter yulinensis]|uniref:Uncharacterized protein n=1 Tax=Pedobacter yulinensis TaxID=2126353 RepID=A0A2T3HJB1_9SPHI|nr:hypothetical protein [Pedobacter yulinensis]PST82538.1 hypothetical protein C7T94_07650 [Pedobacter yulinensis]
MQFSFSTYRLLTSLRQLFGGHCRISHVHDTIVVSLPGRKLSFKVGADSSCLVSCGRLRFDMELETGLEPAHTCMKLLVRHKLIDPEPPALIFAY